jgi:hypothetical protein
MNTLLSSAVNSFKTIICDEMNGSCIKEAAALGRAQLPACRPPENIYLEVSVGKF